MAEYEARHVVVTGAGGGIGRAVALAFLREGATVSAVDRDEDALSALVSAADSARLVTFAGDITIEPSWARMASDLADRGPVEVLANCAGLLRQGRVTEMSLDDFSTMMAVNVTGTFLSCKHLVPHLAGGGAIVNLSSVAAYVGSDGSFAYTASKGAVSSLTFGLAQELGVRGVRVNAVCPGWVDAGFTHQALARAPEPERLHAAARDAHVLGRMARADEVAEAFLFLGSRTRASFVTGSELFVDGGFMVKR
jgi:NAD(P)-dependent dehydrogenase (short-subunit alcohol dehydrogenase family)